MTARPDHESVAAQLREEPPVADDLAKARMEKRLLSALNDAALNDAALNEGARTDGVANGAAPRGGSTSVSRGQWLVAGGVALAAAAALLLVFLRDPAPAAPTARFEVREVGTSAQRGTLEEGSVLTTGADEVADIRIADSSVHLEPGSELRIAALTSERLALELSAGEVRVEFHPRRRGEEHLQVSTDQARVEVVGTVFTVRADGDVTGVAVTEGRVRVVSLEDGEAQMVAGGESVRVGREAHASNAPALDPPEASEPPSGVETETEADPAESGAEETAVVVEPRPTPRAPTAAALLARARALLTEGRRDDAERTLRAAGDARGPARVRAEALTLLGDLLRSSRPGEAAEVYTRVASMEAGSMSHLALIALGRVQERQLGQPAQARRSYARYLELAPEGSNAAQARAALCRLAGEGGSGDESPCPQ